MTRSVLWCALLYFLFVHLGYGVPAQIINVKQKPFNACGDNSHDDRKAIQSAIDSLMKAGGGVLYFPPGIYCLKSFSGYGDTPDRLDAPHGYPTSFSRGFIHLIDTTGHIVYRGDGKQLSILRTFMPSTILQIRGDLSIQAKGCVQIEQLGFENLGGWKAGKDCGYYGVYIRAAAPAVTNCRFLNFLNGLIIAQGCSNAIVSQNDFLWEHGHASIGYPLYPDRDHGLPYLNHPTVGLRNYGKNTTASFNYMNGLMDPDFSSCASVPDSFKLAADGFNHGYGFGGIFTNNHVEHFSYEAFFTEDGPNPQETEVVYQGNTIDGRIGSVRGVGVNYPYKWLRCGQYGIRIDCDNAVVSGNVIRGIIGKGIVMANETGREHKNYNITGNILAECSSGIYIQNSSHGIVSNNIIRAYEPDSGSRQLKLTWKNGIFITGKSSTDILISQNMIYGSKYAWYYDSAFVLKNTKKGGPSISLEHNILYGRGDWVRIGYDENNSGLPYYIQSVQNENIVFNVPLNSDVPQGVKVYISPRDAFEFAGVGVAVTEAKEIFIKNNVFLDCVEPYRAGMKTTSTEGNTFIRCTVSPHEIINPQ